MLDLAGFLGFILFFAMLPCIPLLIYVLRQEERGVLLAWGGSGAIVGAGAGLAVLAGTVGDQASADPVAGYLAGVALMGGGWIIGAHLGVALSRMVSADRDERSGALWGALAGLIIGGALTGLLMLIAGDVHLGMAIGIFVVPLALAVGAIFGAQAGAASHLPSAERAQVMARLRLGLAVLLALAIGLPLLMRLDYERGRAAMRARAREFEQSSRSPDRTAYLKLLRAPDPQQRALAARELGNLAMMAPGDTGIIDALGRVTHDRDAAVRLAAVEALGRTGSPAAIEPLGRALKHRDPNLRYAALQALLRIPDYGISPYIREAAQDSDPRVSGLAQATIAQATRGTH